MAGDVNLLQMDKGETSLPYLEMGTTFLIGLSVGYVLKKSFKLLLFLTGMAVIVLFFMEHQGVIVLDEMKLQEGVGTFFEKFKQSFAFLKDRLVQMHAGSGASALAGFVVGLKLG